MRVAADLLLPRPRDLRGSDEVLLLAEPVLLRVPNDNPALRPALERVARSLAAAGVDSRVAVGEGSAPRGVPSIELAHAAEAIRPQAYRLVVDAAGARIEGHDEAGIFYGAVTLGQWIRLHLAPAASGTRLSLPGLAVDDQPDFVQRGALLDVSRNRVPRMERLLALVDRMADWKLNQLQLYTEHTFAYRDHPAVWRDASPFTAEEIKQLDRYCSERFIELVPNQNSFGHLHRWLSHAAYRHLAERPEGVRHPFGESPEPFSLCPTDPGSIEFVESLWAELLGQFTSRQANAGLDETFDLGSGRSAEECARRGAGRVYLDFLLEVRRILLERGRRMQFWADMMLSHPELVAALPGDVIPLVWGYEADHPFARDTAPFAAAGLTHYVCPGTSSWNSLAGRGPNALANLEAAARAGHESGAAGYLITDWGDNGHLQPPSASGLGWLAGASWAWNGRPPARDEADWAALLDFHFFGPAPGLGAAAIALGRADLHTGVRLRNGSVLFRLLLHAPEDLSHERFEKLSAEGLGSALERLESTRAEIGRLSGGGAQQRTELLWVADLLAFACRLGRERLAAGRTMPLESLPGDRRRRLRRELEPLVEALPELWLATSRPGGLEDSAARLSRIAAGLR